MVLALETPVSHDVAAESHSGSADRLTAFIAQERKRNDAQLVSCLRLEGGAVQENWRLVVEFSEKGELKTEHYVLRTSAKTRLPDSRSKAQEFAILRTAWAAGVLVPDPLWLCEDHSVIGADFFISREVPGRAQGRDIMALNRPEDGNPELLKELGRQLAKIHNIKSLPAELTFLKHSDAGSALQAVRHWRQELDALAGTAPALEWGLRWCENHLPEEPVGQCLLHGDYRTGNYMVGRDQDPRGSLTAILDWEFAQWGDPMSDIGWFCAACWRFDRPDLEAGGVGRRTAFYQAYHEEGGQTIDPKSVYFWEVIAHIRWTIIAHQQGDRFFKGGEGSLDLALTGRLRPAQVQRRLLDLTAPEHWEKGREHMEDLETGLPGDESTKLQREPRETAQLLASAANLFRDEIEPSLSEAQHENGRMLADALACALLDLESASGMPPSAGPKSGQPAAVRENNAIDLHLRLLESISNDLAG